MNELDILNLFYDEMTARGETRDNVFLTIDESAVAIINWKLKTNVTLEEVHRYTDICIANEWLGRTTADPGYHYLNLTAAGLRIVLMARYVA